MKIIKAVCMMILIAGAAVYTACAAGETAQVSPGYPAEPSAASAPSALPPTSQPTPESAPEPTCEPARRSIDDMIASMSDKELIGQMVMIGFEGQKDMDKEGARLVRDDFVGNVMLFGWNTDTFEQTKALTAKIQAYSRNGIPVMIGIDLEGGKVKRFPGEWRPALESAQALGKAGDARRVYDQYRRIGEKLHEIGIMIDFAPVLDIAKKPSETFLGSRMFGGDAEKTAALVPEAVKGLQDGGVASLGKHFPGHGSTPDDSHQTLPVIRLSLEKLRSYSLVPFSAAVDQGIDAMLVGHLLFPKIDNEYPASVSYAFITDLLRKELGFGGVVVSDDMRMQGIRSRFSAGEAAALHILAGGDIVLVGRHYVLQKQVVDALYQAVQDGRITRQRLEESVRRILTLKRAYMDF